MDIDRKYCVYMHINKINGKKYIGITSKKPNDRFGKDGKNYIKCPAFWHAIQKYGWENFEHQILETNLTEEEACKREIELIEKYHTTDKQFGYNISKGGNVLDHECIEKIWERPGYREACSKNQKSICSTPERKEECRTRYYKLMEDAKWKDKFFKAMKAAKSKPVRVIETGVVYESVKAASIALGLNHTLVSRAIRKGYRCRGYHVEYIDIVS